MLIINTSRWARFAHPLLHVIQISSTTYMHNMHAIEELQGCGVKGQILQACRGHSVVLQRSEWLKGIDSGVASKIDVAWLDHHNVEVYVH